MYHLRETQTRRCHSNTNVKAFDQISEKGTKGTKETSGFKGARCDGLVHRPHVKLIVIASQGGRTKMMIDKTLARAREAERQG